MAFLRDRSSTKEIQPVSSAGSFDTRSVPSSDGVRRSSLPDTDQADRYTPPERPVFFRPPRDSMLPQPRRSPLLTQSSPDTSPRSEPSLLSKAHHIRASLASLSRPSDAPPESKTVPRPLLLNSGSLFTPTSPGQSSPILLSASQSAPVLNRDQWDAVPLVKGQYLHKTTQSSASSLSPSDTWGRSPRFTSSEMESDSGIPSRIVPLNRKSVSPMAAGIRTPSRRPSSPASSATSSEKGFASPPTSAHLPAGDSRALANALNLNGMSSSQGDHEHRGVLLSTELSNHAVRRTQRKKAVRAWESEADDTSDSSLAHAPPKNARPRFTRRNTPNLSLLTRDNPHSEQKSVSPNSLAPENTHDHELVTTPKASSFDLSLTSGSRSPRRSWKHSVVDTEDRPKKTLSDAQDHWTKKPATDVPLRTRKVSGESRVRDSAAIEGDDEGYDDLLSAYESEENYRPTAF